MLCITSGMIFIEVVAYYSPTNPLLASSSIYLRTIFSTSVSLYGPGLSLMPPPEPPRGTLTHAFLKELRADIAFTSSIFNEDDSRTPVNDY